MRISFVTASYVAEAVGYPGQGFNWGEAERATVEATTPSTMEHILARLAPAQLDGIELWGGHALALARERDSIAETKAILARHGLVGTACAGGLGSAARDPASAERVFQAAQSFDLPIIASWVSRESAPIVAELAERYNIRVGDENHPERDAAALKETIAGYEEWIGVALDTGNLAVQGGDPVKAIYDLGEALIYLHFKDILPGGGHTCCALGQGIVDAQGVVRALREVGYEGVLSIEIETIDHDPTEEIIESAQLLRELL
jgi:sugar phosphate isomerase/epimerase